MDMNEIDEGPAQVDGTKPRRHWRGNRARIGVLAAVLGMIGALFCLAVVAPPTVDAATATWQDAVIAGAVSGGAIGGAVGTAIPGLGTAAGFVIGMGIGASAAYLGYVVGGWGQDDSASAAQMGAWLAGDEYNQTLAKMMLAQTNAENVAELAQRSVTYYERSAYAASVTLYEEQTQNGETHVYDSDYVLDKSMVADESVGSVCGAYAVYNKVFRQLDSIGASYVGDYSGNSMTINVGDRVNGLEKATAVTYDSHVYLRLVSYCNTPAGKFVWLNATDSITIWNLGSSTTEGTVTITDPDGTSLYSEVMTLQGNGGGYGIDLSTIKGMESGRYNVQLPQSSWIWTANAAEDYANSGVVAPGIAVYTLNSASDLTFLWGWAHLPSDQGFSTSGTWNFAPGYVWKSIPMYNWLDNDGYPYLQFKYKSGSDVKVAGTLDLKPYLDSITKVSRSWRQIMYGASLAGQTSYQVLLDNGGAGTDGMSADALYPPTYIAIPDYDQLNNMTNEALLGVYYAYLNQLNETFQHSNIMDPSTINVSTESFNMLLRGSVYYNGTLVIGNTTVFTLYTTIEGISLEKGKTTELTSAGYLVTWADNYTSLMDYINSKGNVQYPNVTYHDVGPGWSIHVEEITFENQEVNSAELTVDKLETYVPPDLPEIQGPPSGDGASSGIDMICIVVIAVGVILLIVGMVADNTAVCVGGIALAVISAAAWYISTLDFSLGLWSLANAPEYLSHWWR